MNQIKLYDLFRREMHLSDDKAAEAVYAVQEMTESAFTSKKEVLATKEDIFSVKSELKKDIHSLRAELKEDIHSLRAELKEDIHSLKAELKEDIHFLKSELKEDVHSLRAELKKDILATKEDIFSVKSELKKDIQDSKDNLYRAIYLSGILQFIAMTGSLLAIIKLMK
jgi:hypothetical protein